MTATTPTIVDRLHHAIFQCRAQHHTPAWIILGQEEWLGLRMQMARLEAFPMAVFYDEVTLPRFYGVPIAVVPTVGHHLEVVPEAD